MLAKLFANAAYPGDNSWMAQVRRVNAVLSMLFVALVIVLLSWHLYERITLGRSETIGSGKYFPLVFGVMYLFNFMQVITAAPFKGNPYLDINSRFTKRSPEEQFQAAQRLFVWVVCTLPPALLLFGMALQDTFYFYVGLPLVFPTVTYSWSYCKRNLPPASSSSYDNKGTEAHA